MRDELFEYYVKLGHNLYYLRAYKISARRFGNAYTATITGLTTVSIAALSSWNVIPSVLALITLCAQLLSALKPLTQAAQQRSALKYVLQDLSALFDEVAIYWETVGACEKSLTMAEEIAEKLTRWKERERQIDDRFCGDVDFPFKERLDKKATKENTRYFWYHYRVKPEEEEKK